MSKNFQNNTGSTTPKTGVRTSSKMLSDADFNPDYSNITKDLKRIGILAVSFFSILVILSFFLR